MSQAGELFSSPPDGVTYALPQEDFPGVLKRKILAWMEARPWNLYLDPSLSQGRDVLSTMLSIDPATLTLTHGADDAIRRIAEGLQPTAILYPLSGYPGYRRAVEVTSSQGKTYVPDATAQDIRSQLDEGGPGDRALVYVCWPGNPIGSTDQLHSLNLLTEAAGAVVVDLTYMNPLGKDFASVARNALGCEASVVFSFSKSLGLAGVRLGGVITAASRPLALSPSEHFPWTLFQALTLDAILDPDNSSELQAYASRQLALRAEIVRAAYQVGIPIAYADGITFVSIHSRELTEVFLLEAASRGVAKHYPELGLIRLDVSHATLNLIGRVGAPTSSSRMW